MHGQSEPTGSAASAEPQNIKAKARTGESFLEHISSSSIARRSTPADEALRGIIGVNSGSEEKSRKTGNDGQRGRGELGVKREANKLDGVGERIDAADLVEQRARFLDAPEGIERRGGEEHRKNNEVHDPREVLELPYNG